MQLLLPLAAVHPSTGMRLCWSSVLSDWNGGLSLLHIGFLSKLVPCAGNRSNCIFGKQHQDVLSITPGAGHAKGQLPWAWVKAGTLLRQPLLIGKCSSGSPPCTLSLPKTECHTCFRDQNISPFKTLSFEFPFILTKRQKAL